nr:protocadherin alpha-2-like isoform X3 [Misgurnus anguillicaudatus]
MLKPNLIFCKENCISELFIMGSAEQRRGWEYWWIALRFSLLLCFGLQVSAQIRYTIPEEAKEGSVVGNIAKDLGLDVSTLVNRRFRIVSGSEDTLFQVNPDNGILYVHKRIDREEQCDGNTVCIVNIKTVVEDPLEVHYVAVDVTDVNDHSPKFPEKKQIVEIAESTQPGARFQLQAARDPDIGVNAVRSYKLSQNEHFDLEIRDRGDEKNPFLLLRRPLDRESQAEHKLILTAIDGGNPHRSGVLNITVTVLDNNDNRPVFSQEVYTVNLQENVQPDTVVIKVNATDVDEGLNGEVRYTLDGNLNGKVNDIFLLDSVSGEIRVRNKIDFEDVEVYRLDIFASDKGNPPMTVDCRVIVKILDVNDNAPEIEITSLSNVIPEDSKPGTVISLISVSDRDSGANGKVVCTLSANVPFEIKPSVQDNMYSLVSKTHLDRETTSQYEITIIATDLGQPSLTSFKTLTVQISDVNDNKPDFIVNPLELYLPENNVPGGFIYAVTAFDKDINDNALISYHLIRGDGTQNDMASFLNINSETGVISALKSFDFETSKTFQFQVLATDSGSPSLSSNVTVNVFILDQNDNVPVILYPVSANGSAEGVEEIPRNVNAGHLVTKVRAYDADIGYNGWLLFSLQEVSDHSLFGLDRYTGQIRTLRSFTETDEARHKLVILVKDNGNVSLSATATVIVKVVEPKEAFAASDVTNAVKDEEENNVTFYLIITLGSVSVLFIISIIVLIVMQCSKSSDYSSKYLQDANYDGTLCHSIQYRSGDKRYMLVGPRMSVGSTLAPGSNRNTLVIPDRRRRDSGESTLKPKVPNTDWRYSASLRAGMQSSVHMEESSVMQGAHGVMVQNWPTVSSAADQEGGEVSPPIGAGVDSNSWHFRYGPPGGPPPHLKPGEVPPEAFIIPGSPAIISIRQGQDGDDKSDFISFGKKDEAKMKKKKKKKEKKDKRDKGKDDDD